MDLQNAGGVAAEERARIAVRLSRYPDLSPDELAEIHNWFNRVASAMDVGIIASDEHIAVQYRAYRAEHIDRLKLSDFGKVILFIGMILIVIGVLVLAMP